MFFCICHKLCYAVWTVMMSYHH